MTCARRYARIAGAAWLLAAVAILVYTLLRPEVQADERAGLSGLVPLYFLSFPLGHAAVAGLAQLKIELYVAHGLEPGVRAEALLLWTSMTVLGALQWFVLVPWLARGLRRLADFLFRRFFTR